MKKRTEIRLFTYSWFFMGVVVGNGLWVWMIPVAVLLGFWGGRVEEIFDSKVEPE